MARRVLLRVQRCSPNAGAGRIDPPLVGRRRLWSRTAVGTLVTVPMQVPETKLTGVIRTVMRNGRVVAPALGGRPARPDFDSRRRGGEFILSRAE